MNKGFRLTGNLEMSFWVGSAYLPSHVLFCGKIHLLCRDCQPSVAFRDFAHVFEAMKISGIQGRFTPGGNGCYFH